MSARTAAGRDIFLVFVDALSGQEAEYGSWFSGSHMKDMRRLSGVASAKSYLVATQDDHRAPAAFCAVYEMDDARAVLSEIARLRGSPALPSSPLQGAMTWRIFETVSSLEARQQTAEAPLPLALVPTTRDKSPPVDEIRHLHEALADKGVNLVRYMRLSELQPRRGADFGWAVFAHLPIGASEVSEFKLRLTQLNGNAPIRLLRLTPSNEGEPPIVVRNNV
jgi:hypothetical protein